MHTVSHWFPARPENLDAEQALQGGDGEGGGIGVTIELPAQTSSRNVAARIAPVTPVALVGRAHRVGFTICFASREDGHDFVRDRLGLVNERNLGDALLQHDVPERFEHPPCRLAIPQKVAEPRVPYRAS